MFERFTERARQVVASAIDEARTHGHNYVGTEHLLIGLLLDKESAASRVLESYGIDAGRALAWIEREVGRGTWGAVRDLAFTPRAKRALERAVREADSRVSPHVDSEHVLLGLVGVEDGLAVRVLAELGADPRRVAEDVAEALGASAR